MKTIKKYLQFIKTWILPFILASLLLFTIDRCEKNNQNRDVIIIKTTIKKHISKKNLIPADTIYPEPELITQTKFIFDTIFIYDTIYTVSDIVIDYFTKYNIKDTIRLDTAGTVFLNDSITQNCLYYRGIDYEIYSYTKIVQDKKHFKAFLGTFYVQNDIFNSIGAEVSVSVKRNMFTAGIGTNKTYLFNYKRLIFEK